MSEWDFLQVERDRSTPEELAESLSRDLARLHPFDPVRTLAIAFAATSATPTISSTSVKPAVEVLRRIMGSLRCPDRF